ncbi:MAG TPA: hypothetical protein VFV87_10575 [Pirellulaceae bacterium]|nr:hypothetical protein [Pirellulaceae bacterium]
MLRSAWVAIGLVLAVAALAEGKERIWTNSAGQSMRAEFVREVDGEVTFLKGGKIVSVPLDSLSERDQQIVRDLAAGKPVSDDAPAAPGASPFSGEGPISGPATPGAEANREPLIKKPIPIENRTWTDIHGNQITGKFVRIFGSNVVIHRASRSVTVKFFELGSEDQEYVRELLTSRGQEGLIPPKVDVEEGTGDTAGGESAPAEEPTATESLPAAAAPASPQVPRGPSFGPGFPGGAPPGPSFPGRGPGFPSPGADPPGVGAGGYTPPSYTPPTPAAPSSFPSSDPYAAPGSRIGSGYADAQLERMRQQNEENQRRQAESMQRMQDRMSAQHESFMNRFKKQGECLNCKHSLTEAEFNRTSCPHCGVTWDYEVDEFGHKRELHNSSYSSPLSRTNNGEPLIDARSARQVGMVLGIFLGLAVVVGMIIGVIYIAMTIASASSSSQQRHYR